MIQRRNFPSKKMVTPRERRSFFPRGRMSVGCSTTQSKSVEREESAAYFAYSLAAKNHKACRPNDWRVSAMAREFAPVDRPLPIIIHSAIRSAERGPTPGICRSWAIKFRIATGYSVLLKAHSASPRRTSPSGRSFHGRFRQLKNKRLESDVNRIAIQGRSSSLGSTAPPKLE